MQRMTWILVHNMAVSPDTITAFKVSFYRLKPGFSSDTSTTTPFFFFFLARDVRALAELNKSFNVIGSWSRRNFVIRTATAVGSISLVSGTAARSNANSILNRKNYYTKRSLNRLFNGNGIEKLSLPFPQTRCNTVCLQTTAEETREESKPAVLL